MAGEDLEGLLAALVALLDVTNLHGAAGQGWYTWRWSVSVCATHVRDVYLFTSECHVVGRLVEVWTC